MQRLADTDAELVERIGSGDEAALRELLERHTTWLMLRLRRRTMDEDLVASAVQDTFVTVWRTAGSYRGDGEVGAWLWGIAVRRLVDRLRVRRGPTPVPDAVLRALSPQRRSAEDEVLLTLEHGDLGAAWDQLAPDLRRALQATVVDGLSTREAAQLLGVPQGTVKSRVRLGKEALRRHIVEAEAR